MFKKFSLAVVAVVLLAGGAMADDVLSSAGIDLASISDANNAVVEASLNVDVDELANKTGDKNDQAVEACFRSWGCGYSCYYPSYSYCYYPCYSYCYTPTYFCYRPVCYTYTSYCYPLAYWGCY